MINRILSVGELLRTVVVVLKHAFTKEALHTDTPVSRLDFGDGQGPCKSVFIFLFHSCTVYLCIIFALLLLLLFTHFTSPLLAF